MRGRTCHTPFFELRCCRRQWWHGTAWWLSTAEAAGMWHACSSTEVSHSSVPSYSLCFCFCFLFGVYFWRTAPDNKQLMSRASTEIIYVICDIRVSKSMSQAFILWDRMLYLEHRNAFYLFVPGVSVPSVVITYVKRYVLCKLWFLLEGRDITSGNRITRELNFVNCRNQTFSSWIHIHIWISIYSFLIGTIY